MFSDYVYKWLDNALDIGIKEYEFWDMTLLELERAFASAKRLQEIEARKKANFDYRLADLIGRSIARVYNSVNKMPDISEANPGIFSAEEVEEKKLEKKQELSALRFKQFADAFNKRFAEGGKDE